MSKRLIILREEYAGMRLDTFLPFYFINSKYPGSCKMKGDSQDRPRMLGLKTTGDKLNEEWEGLTRSAFKKLIANGAKEADSASEAIKIIKKGIKPHKTSLDDF